MGAFEEVRVRGDLKVWDNFDFGMMAQYGHALSASSQGLHDFVRNLNLGVEALKCKEGKVT